MKNFILCCFVFLLPTVLSAQGHPGFSKLYHYSADTIMNADLIRCIIYDSASQGLYFSQSSLSYNSLKRRSTFYKSDLDGNVLLEKIDSLNGTIVYYSVIASNNNEYLYWGGRLISILIVLVLGGDFVKQTKI